MIEGHPDRPRLDWRSREHYGGPIRPCRICLEPSWCFVDDDGRPCHRTCAEMELYAGPSNDPRAGVMERQPCNGRNEREAQK